MSFDLGSRSRSRHRNDMSEFGSSLGSERSLLGTCLTTVAQPAAYDILYNIDGGVDKKATMPLMSPPYVALTTLDTLAPVS